MVVEGGPPASAKSFAEVLQASLAFQKVVIPVHDPAFTDKGESACFFSKDEIGASLSPVRFAVIAKTPYGRPPFQEIRNHIQQRCSLTGSFVISSIDSVHLLIRFALEDDFLKVLLRESLLVRGKVFKFFKWSPLLRPNEDPHIIPVWIDLPGLPINLYQECFVRSIACNVGKVLQVAHDTVNLINTQAARVCVEVDLLLPRKERIWIGMGDYGYWQVILYPRLPAYCTICKRIGHGADSCGTPVSEVNKDSSVLLRKNQAPLSKPTTKTIEPAPKQNTTANWRQVSKGKRKIGIHLPSDVPSTSTSNMFNLLDSSGAGGVEEAGDGVKEGGSCPAPVVCLAPSIPALPAAPAAFPISQEAVVHDLHGVGVSRKALASSGVDVHGGAALPCGGGSSGVTVSPETRPVLEEGETPVNLESRVSVADVAFEGSLQVSSLAAVESSVALAKHGELVAETFIQEGGLATKESSLSQTPVDSASRFLTAAEVPATNSASRGPGAHGEPLQCNTRTRESTAAACSEPARDPRSNNAAPSSALLEATNSATWGPALAPPSAAALAVPAGALSADCSNAAPNILVDRGDLQAAVVSGATRVDGGASGDRDPLDYATSASLPSASRQEAPEVAAGSTSADSNTSADCNKAGYTFADCNKPNFSAGGNRMAASAGQQAKQARTVSGARKTAPANAVAPSALGHIANPTHSAGQTSKCAPTVPAAFFSPVDTEIAEESTPSSKVLADLSAPKSAAYSSAPCKTAPAHDFQVPAPSATGPCNAAPSTSAGARQPLPDSTYSAPTSADHPISGAPTDTSKVGANLALSSSAFQATPADSIFSATPNLRRSTQLSVAKDTQERVNVDSTPECHYQQSPQSFAGQADKNISSSSSGSRKMISRPSRKGGVRIYMPVPRPRSPSPPPPAVTYTPKFNMEAARAVLEQSKAENIFMPGFTYPSEESDNHDDDDDAFDYDYNERCRRRPGLRPRGVLRRSHSWDDFSLEF